MLHMPAPAIAQAVEPSNKRRPRIVHDTSFGLGAPWNRDPASLPRRQWLYGTHYLRGSVSLTVADGGVGKSTLVVAEAVAMASGRSLLGVQVERPLNVLYWGGEEDRDEIERRVHATCQHFGIKPRELESRLRIASGFDNPICIVKTGGQVDDDLITRFVASQSERQIDVLIIDPLVRCHSVAENDNTAIGAVAAAWVKLARSANISIALAHHTRKAGSGSESGGSEARGASALVCAARAVRVLTVMSEAEATRAGIANPASFFRAHDPKANYAPRGEVGWFQIVAVDLANGDNVATVAPWCLPNASDGVTPDDATAVMELARAGQYRADPRSREWIGNAVADVLHLDAEADRRRIKEILRSWYAAGVLKRVERKGPDRHDCTFVEAGE
jgi:AAA domain